jgi:hypothetical protein
MPEQIICDWGMGVNLQIGAVLGCGLLFGCSAIDTVRCAPEAGPQTDCSDGICTPALETCRMCPEDCDADCNRGGESFCDAAETAATCPGDCP